MLSLPEQIKNLETLSQQELSPEARQILSKEIERLKQEKVKRSIKTLASKKIT